MLAGTNGKDDAPQGRHRLPGAERRAAIIKTALDMFAKRGFRGTTTRELASAVGVSEPVLYQHFATKHDLYTAIVDHMVDQGAAEFEAAFRELETRCCDPRAFLQTVGELILHWYLDETHHIRLLLFSALESHELADLWYERAVTRFVAVFEEYLRGRIAEGLFRVEDPSIAARAFIGMVAHYGLVSAIFGRPVAELSREETVGHFVTLFLNGVRPQTAAAGS